MPRDESSTAPTVTTVSYEIERFVSRYELDDLRLAFRPPPPEGRRARMAVEIRRIAERGATEILVTAWMPRRRLVARDVDCTARVCRTVYTSKPATWVDHLRQTIRARWPRLGRWVRPPRTARVPHLVSGMFPGIAKVDVVYLLDPTFLGGRDMGWPPDPRPRVTSVQFPGDAVLEALDHA